MNSRTASIEKLGPFTTVQIPRVNAYWPAQGGKFRGIVRGEAGQPDYLLIEHVDELPEANWQACMAAAAALEVDGHKDFTLPNRVESALLYANAKDEHNQDDWHWTSEQHAEDPEWAWVQGFNLGYQFYGHQSNEYRARAVRRIVI